jgi:diguanylate cyclase (GGDEF)-like protein/PAS domain S-box-containing protein
VDSRYGQLGDASAQKASGVALVSATLLDKCSEELRLKSTLLENVGDGVIANSLDGVIVYANDMASRLMGYEPTEMLGLSRWSWMTDEAIAQVPQQIAAIRANNGLLYETDIRTKYGHVLCAEVHSRIVDVAGYGELVVSVTRDVTARSVAHENMRHLAFHDILTGLGNRVMLEESVKQALASASDSNYLGLVFLDLDDFKPVNDTYGHAMGDQVLRIIGERLRACVRESDTIARIGGDEFIALFPGLCNEAALGSKAMALAECVSEPIGIDGVTVRVSASVGLSTYEPGEHPDEFITRADHAMYRAKLHGVAGWEEFLARVS